MISLSTLKRFLAEKFHMKESILDEYDRVRMLCEDFVFDILVTKNNRLSIVLEKDDKEYVKIADSDISLKEVKNILRDMVKEYGRNK